MKAIMRQGAGLFGLLLLAASSHAQIWVSPVFKQPYPVAPSPSNMAPTYMLDMYGNWRPYYYLQPSQQPFNGILPGQVGQAIMQGNLPHTLLMSKEGMNIGKVPLIGQKPEPPQGQPQMPPNGMPPYAGTYAGMHGQNYGMAPQGMQPYGMQPHPGTQVPYYGNVPRSTFPMQSPYGQPMPMQYPPMPYPPMQYPPMPYPMPMGGPQMPYAMPYPGMMPSAPMMPTRTVGYYPYYPTQVLRQDPRTGVWQVQNVIPNIPQLPQQPGMNNGPPQGGFPFVGQMQPNDQFNGFGQFNPMQGPQMPRMDDPRMDPLQAPRMEMYPPPKQRPQPCFPTHPFVRSPRDFFMWGENMEDEQRLRNQRPFPVPQ